MAKAAIENEDIINAYVRAEMHKRRDIMIKLLHDEFDLSVSSPVSSLYIFISLARFGVKNVTSTRFCASVLQDASVAIIPGSAFGKEGYIRLSFGSEDRHIIQGMKALSVYLKNL